MPDSSISEFNKLAEKYRGTDSLAFATIRTYTAQAWDSKKEGDSIIAACEDGLAYFATKPKELNMRFMGHFFSAWGYTYKKNLLTANYYFSLAGNELTDTIYLQDDPKPITSSYQPDVKAAMLQEIAAMARQSRLNGQANHYINLSLNYITALPEPDLFLKAVIYMEAATIYTRQEMYDSAYTAFRLVAIDLPKINDTLANQMYRERKSLLALATTQYDTAIKLSLQYQHTAADTLITNFSESSQQLYMLSLAYTAKGDYDKAAAVLHQIELRLSKNPDLLGEFHIAYLEAKMANSIARHEGIAGYNLVKEYIATKDEIFDQQRISAIEDMDARFRVRRKEEAITRLNSDNKDFARKVRMQSIILTITVLVLLLFAAVLVIYYQRQVRRKLQENVATMELEQRLLRSQMEPHFIFNTLAVLQGLIRNDEKDRSIKYLNQFARLLRISLEHAREPLVTLRGEIEAISHYLSLQELRFKDSFTYSIETWDGFEEEQEELLIPPMLLQPFAENALAHGMKGLDGKNGKISIALSKMQGSIRCIIKDNGSGFDTNAPVHKGEKQSLATIITRERLAILAKESGKPAGLEISSTKNQGTTVTLMIPFSMAKEPSDG